MQITNHFYLTGEAYRLWIETNPEVVSVSAYNVQEAPLSISFWLGEGIDKASVLAYLTLKVEAAYSEVAMDLYKYDSPSAIIGYDYTIPESSYPTANRISIYAYEDSARTKLIASKQVNIVAKDATPFPVGDSWESTRTYKNGEYILLENVLYMWSSRVSGNTSTDPKTWLQNNKNSGLWTVYPYNKLLAAQIFLANFALIGSAVFQDEYMISQQGMDDNGNTSFDYRNFGKGTFFPNLMLDFKKGDCNLVGSISRGMVIYESNGPFTITPKSNIYVIKNAQAQNQVVLYTGSGSRSYGLEFTIINGGSGACLVSYITGSPFLFKGKLYGVMKLSKPGDIAELIFSPVLHSVSPDMGIAFIIRNKSDFKASSDGITLESI